MDNEIILLDLPHLFWSAFHATGDLEVGKAVEIVKNKVYGDFFDARNVAVCIDYPPYNRSKIYPEYKQNRPPKSQLAVDQLSRLIDDLRDNGFPIVGVDGLEADDVIASIVAKTENKVTIVTADKDLLQLVSDRVFVQSSTSGEILDKKIVYDKYGVWPHQLLDVFALAGDKADNVPGIPGVGLKTAAKLIQKFGTANMLIDCAVEKTESFQELTPALKQKIRDNIDNIPLARSLIALDTTADIDLDQIFKPRVLQKITSEGLDDLNAKNEQSTPAIQPAQQDLLTVDISPSKNEKIIRYEGEAALVDWKQRLEPNETQTAWKLACTLHESRLYTKFPNPPAILAVIMRGRELGIGATTSLEGFHVVEGAPHPSAHLVTGLALKSPLCEYVRCLETSDQSATYETKRVGQPPMKYTYTIEMAERAELLGKTKNGRATNWHKRPDAMLRKTCVLVLLRIVYPDVINGLYAYEEMQ